MMKAWVIRLWVSSILLCLAAAPARSRAQAAASAAQPSQSTPAASSSESAEDAAYDALNTKHFDEAEKDFQAILAKDPANESALAGMGFVRLQQANFLGAISYLEQAKQKDPNDRTVAAALDTARFWSIMGEGQSALAANDLVAAEKNYRAALELRADSPEALAGLGNTLLKAKQPQQAIAPFEKVVAAQPDSVDGWRGLVMAQYQAGHAPEALTADQRIPPAIQAQLKGDPAFVSALASVYKALGRDADAKKVLASAVTPSAPTEVTPAPAKNGDQLQLAAGLSADQPEKAVEAYRQMLGADGTNTAAWKGLIETLHAMGHDDEALATALGMPPASHNEAVLDPTFDVALAGSYRAVDKLDTAQDLLLQAVNQLASQGRSASPEIELQLGDIDIQRGSPQLAFPIYKQVLRDNPNNVDAWAGLFSTLHLTGHDSDVVAQLPTVPSAIRPQLEANSNYVQTMALVHSDLDHPREAIPAVASNQPSVAVQSVSSPTDPEIQNARQLYDRMDDAGLYRQLLSLGNRTDLTDEQRRTVQSIWTDWAVRRANQAATVGNATRSLAILNAASQSFPDNPAVLREVANGYAQTGQPMLAVQIYKGQNMSAVSSADYQAAVSSALATDDNKDAEVWLRFALAKYPVDPQILLLGARFEQVRGDAPRAMQYYRESLKAMPPPSADAKGAVPAPPAGLPSGSPVRALAVLLAPGNVDAIPANTPAVVPAPAPTSPATAALAPPSSTPHPDNGATLTAAVPAASEDGYRPFVPYIAPPSPTPPVAAVRSGVPVQVQLGNSAKPPVQAQTEKTDVLPTARYAPNNRKAPVLKDPNMAAAQAARIRREQAEVAAAQIAQPSTRPPGDGRDMPDSSTQQYPQPRTPPTVASGRTVSPAPAVQVVTPPAPPPAESKPATPQAVPPEIASPPPANPQANAPVAVQPYVPQAYPTAPPPTDAELAAHNLPPLGGNFEAKAPITATPRQQAQTALASLEGLYSGWLGPTGIGRFRAGTPGLDRLYDVETPVELSGVIGRAARLTAVARPVFLNSGVLNGSGSATLPYLGTLPTNTATPPAQQSVNSVGGELQLVARAAGLAVGYTPYSFLVHNVTGRASWRPLGGHLLLFGERDSVKDTQLSYAGLRDPGVSTTTGPIWGGVIATTGGARIDFDSNGSGFYISGDGGVLTGRHVLDNSRVGGSAGAYFRVGNWPGRGSLTLGGTFAGMHYAQNEAGMSYGQGGYFSPRYYFLAAAPVTFKGSSGSNFHYSAMAALGVQTFQQDQAAFYPLDAVLQNKFAPCVGTPSYACGQYPQIATTAFNYSVDAEASYRFADHWFGGGFVVANNSENFNAVSAGFFLRYAFRSQTYSEGRPTGLFPMQGLRPLQIP